MNTTLNVPDEDLIKHKVLTKQELSKYSNLSIKSSDGHEKWLFLHTVQTKILDAVSKGIVSEVEQTISEPKEAPAIRGAN